MLQASLSPMHIVVVIIVITSPKIIECFLCIRHCLSSLYGSIHLILTTVHGMMSNGLEQLNNLIPAASPVNEVLICLTPRSLFLPVLPSVSVTSLVHTQNGIPSLGRCNLSFVSISSAGMSPKDSQAIEEKHTKTYMNNSFFSPKGN